MIRGRACLMALTVLTKVRQLRARDFLKGMATIAATLSAESGWDVSKD